MLHLSFKMARWQREKEPGTLGSRIRSIRGNLSQEEFAKLLRIGRAMISNYESDKNIPSTSVLLQISLYSGSTMEWLLTGNSPAGSDPKSNIIPVAERIDLAAQALEKIDMPETVDFIAMMRDVFANRTRMHRVMEFYGFEKSKRRRD